MNRRVRSQIGLLLIAALCLATSTVVADERLAGIACRSVHLGYPGPEGTVFYNEMSIDTSAVGSYFMVCGWNKGYFGMQELGNGKKLLIFSVWDSGHDDPSKVPEEDRVKLLHKDDAVRIGRFGGEGSGGQSFFDFDWQPKTIYRFAVTARLNGKRTEYSGHFFLPESKTWKHLVTFSTITGGKPLSGYYSFVEDFKRDKVSTTHARRAHFGNAWLKTLDGNWIALAKARFTADGNPALNIDAGLDDGRFFLATGGETKNVGTKLRDLIESPAAAEPPVDVRKLGAE
jgi:hypothetical protein